VDARPSRWARHGFDMDGGIVTADAPIVIMETSSAHYLNDVLLTDRERSNFLRLAASDASSCT